MESSRNRPFHVAASNKTNHVPVKRRRTQCKKEVGNVLKSNFYQDSSCRHTVTHYGHFLDEPNNLHHNIPNAQNSQSFIVVLNIVIISDVHKPVDRIFYETYPALCEIKPLDWDFPFLALPLGKVIRLSQMQGSLSIFLAFRQVCLLSPYCRRSSVHF